MLINISGLGAGYGGGKVLHDISLTVKEGEILAVIGRNGVGKTTLMKALIGDVKPMEGSINFKGKDITKLRPAQRAREGIGYVPQGRGIFNRMTVGGNLKLGETVGSTSNGSGFNYDRVYDYFPILEERFNQKAGTMSGGQQQQLSLGRVLVGHPELILLDEPSEGIQPNIVQQIGHIIRRLRDQEGLTVIIVEQNLELIRSTADRCIVIDKGAIVAEISPDELADPAVAKRYLAI